MSELPDGNRRAAFAGWPMLVAWAGMIIFALHSCTHMVGAGDTWVAMACGRHFINHGVDTVEPFSANSHKPGPTEKEIQSWPGPVRWLAEKVGIETVRKWHPTGWINQNWLTHVIFYWLTHKSPVADAHNFSFNTLVYWKFAIYILTVICVYYTGRILGANPALCAVFACFAVFVGRSFYDIRPAGFSNLMVAVFFLVLALTTYRDTRYVWLLVPVTVFWCNLHGGYIYLFIMLVPFVGLHLLILLPKRWTLTVYSIAMWLALYLLTYRFLNYEPSFLTAKPFTPIPLVGGGLFYLLVLLTIISLLCAALKNVSDELTYAYHILAAIVMFLALLPKFFPEADPRLPLQVKDTITKHISSGQWSFLLLFMIMVVLGIVVTFLKRRLVCIGTRGVIHSIAAGAVALVAMILFNPFHLTNLTHTFLISVSKHAELWRNVNEWHPAFEWSNPVGTSFPFLVLVLMAATLVVLRLLAGRLRPTLLKGSEEQLEAQQKKYSVRSWVLGCVTALFAVWVLAVSLSFINLDFLSFVFCALFVAVVLLSVYTSVHFIYILIPLSLLAVWTATGHRGYMGRYIFPFLVIPAYVLTYVIMSQLIPKLRAKPANIIFVSATAVVSLLLVLTLFNPFAKNLALPAWPTAAADGSSPGVGQWIGAFASRFGSCLTSVKSYAQFQRPWRPAYEGKDPLDYSNLFPVLYVTNALAVAVWLLIGYLRKLFGAALQQDDGAAAESATFQPAKIDLPLLIMGALTIYMAIRSRRFITIAAIAACPLMALVLEQTVRLVAAARTFYRRKRFAVPAFPRNLEAFLKIAGVVVVAGLGIFWGVKFKHIYLDPWPIDREFNSVFMRMTASHAKPFHACEFIRANKLKGKMFNYWTEGGFIAWGQEPDPNTGRTPLQLFMDGRAQAAYEPIAFQVWTNISSGGPVAQNAKRLKTKLTAEKYKQVGKWISKQLRRRNVWVALMPAGEWLGPFVRGLEHNSEWQLVFLNTKQKLFVDIKTPQGKQLFDGIAKGMTIYPDEVSRNIMLARAWLRRGKTDEARRKGFDYALKAFQIEPSQITLAELLYAVRFAQFQPIIFNVCKQYFDDFTQNKTTYIKQNGYHNRLVTAFLCAQYLQRVAENKKDEQLADFYRAKVVEYKRERVEVLQRGSW